MDQGASEKSRDAKQIKFDCPRCRRSFLGRSGPDVPYKETLLCKMAEACEYCRGRLDSYVRSERI